MRDTRTPRPVLWFKWTVTLVAALIFAHWASAGADVITQPTEPRPAQVQAIHPRIAAIIGDAARCWSGSDAPLAPLPSAAVVELVRSGRIIHTTDPVLLDAAFNEALGSPSSRVNLVALCTR